MLFNSYAFLIFLPVVFALYWSIGSKRLRIQNALILTSSYVFYGWWDYRFLVLIFVSTITDFVIGLYIPRSNNEVRKKQLLWLSVCANIGLLGVFKYFNFFIESWLTLLGLFGYSASSSWTLNIILPVGISFYTFQSLSYTIDVYRNKISPTSSFIDFASYVAFFPQLIAGPIERATNLLPQVLNKRKFNFEQGAQGMRLMLWGFFKKVVVADQLAPIVDEIFFNYHSYDSGTLWIGAIYFSFQIYCDFSGYSDIAIGVSKLLGFELRSNFKFPYLSRSIGEFWRRWHISLSTWFRDYLYIPLGGSKKSGIITIRNVFLLFLISGLWHGAKATFLFWGLFHAMIYIIAVLLKNNRKNIGTVIAYNHLFPSAVEVFQVVRTFLIITIGLVIFRSDSLLHSLEYLQQMFQITTLPQSFRGGFISIFVVYIIEYIFRHDDRTILYFKRRTSRRILYLILLTAIMFNFFKPEQTTFIYFQF
ncbi:MBOAT family protein [Flavobacteriaceae bacterium]|nr:MBOAT family protein [Flavobacteriaceae bacterium]